VITPGFQTIIKYLFLSALRFAEPPCASGYRTNTRTLLGIVTVTQNRADGCSDRHTNSGGLPCFSGGIYLISVRPALGKITLVTRFIDTTAINDRFVGTAHQEQR
jgi:hypothetical protein